MPTIFIEGYIFRFYSSDINEPPHVHIIRDDNVAKIWLQPIEVEYNYGYNRPTLNRLLRMTSKIRKDYWRLGILTSVSKVLNQQVAATDVRFESNNLFISLSDGREVSLPIDKIDWLTWLAKATAEQRANWSIEPRGFAVYWEELDDGIEVSHILAMQPLA